MRPNTEVALVPKLAERLSHVLWLGGPPIAGKTTVARYLAGKYDLKLYAIDWHNVHEHGNRLDAVRHATAYQARYLSMEERYGSPSVDELVERVIRVWTEEFEFVVEDLLATPTGRVVISEGPGAYPWCVAPLLESPRQAAWIVPRSDFREKVLAERIDAAGGRWGDAYRETEDPEGNQLKKYERDIRLGQEIKRSAQELGLHVIEPDGSCTLSRLAAALEEHHRPFLPAEMNV